MYEERKYLQRKVSEGGGVRGKTTNRFELTQI
jgi:hypothetical protein